MKTISDFLESKKIPKSRALLHLILTFLTAGVWILVAILIEIYIASSRENRLWESNRKQTQQIASLKSQIENNQEIIENLIELRARIETSNTSAFSTPFEMPIVWLWESREQISSVTSGTTLGKTRTGSVGLGWSDGIGWAASQGVTRGTIASQTTEMIKNEFMQLDSGSLRIGNDFVAFIGKQFTRTGFYKDILAINVDYDKGIGLSIVNVERIWLTRFPAEFEKEIALSIIRYAFTQSTGNGSATLDNLFKEIESNIETIKKEIRTSEEKLEVLRKVHENLGPV